MGSTRSPPFDTGMVVGVGMLLVGTTWVGPAIGVGDILAAGAVNGGALWLVVWLLSSTLVMVVIFVPSGRMVVRVMVRVLLLARGIARGGGAGLGSSL